MGVYWLYLSFIWVLMVLMFLDLGMSLRREEAIEAGWHRLKRRNCGVLLTTEGVCELCKGRQNIIKVF